MSQHNMYFEHNYKYVVFIVIYRFAALHYYHNTIIARHHHYYCLHVRVFITVQNFDYCKLFYGVEGVRQEVRFSFNAG